MNLLYLLASIPLLHMIQLPLLIYLVLDVRKIKWAIREAIPPEEAKSLLGQIEELKKENSKLKVEVGRKVQLRVKEFA